MKYFRRSHMPFQRRKAYRDAALVYVLGKTINQVLTFYFMSCVSCSNPKIFIIRSILHIVIFSHFIYLGLTIPVMILTFIMFLRTLISFINFIYPHSFVLHFPIINKPFEIMSEGLYGRWVFFVIAAITAVIAYMLVQAIRSYQSEKKLADKKGNCPYHSFLNFGKR